MVAYEPITLSPEALERLQQEIADAYASSKEPVGRGVRDARLLQSASDRPLTSLGKVSKYKTAYQGAAALGHSVVNNHPFVDGNKRTGLLSMIALLDRQRIGLEASNKDAFDFMVQVAQHRLPGVETKNERADADEEVGVMAAWLKTNSRKTQAGEELLVYRELMKALHAFGVEEFPRQGNLVDLRRSVGGRSLRSQIGYIGRGNMQVEPGTVRKVRTELELDETHGIDHDRFYDAAPPLNALLLKFRGALDALAEYDRSGRPPKAIAER